MKITLIEGPHAQLAKRDASQLVVNIIKRDFAEIGKPHQKKAAINK